MEFIEVNGLLKNDKKNLKLKFGKKTIPNMLKFRLSKKGISKIKKLKL